MHLYEWVLCIMYVLINGGALYIYCSINHILVHGRFKSLKKSLEVNAQFWNNHLNPLEKSPHNNYILQRCFLAQVIFGICLRAISQLNH